MVHFSRIYISSWVSILTNVIILTNPLPEYIYQNSLIIKSFCKNIYILMLPSQMVRAFQRILYKNIYILLGEYSYESNNFNYKMDEHQIESKVFNFKILLSEYSRESLFNKIHRILLPSLMVTIRDGNKRIYIFLKRVSRQEVR